MSEPLKLIFLDIDGVLNRHEWLGESESCDINRECVLQFNRIIKATGAKIVLSSAWRYMVHGGAMTLSGFSYMLRTHGMTCKAEIIGLTVTDEEIALRGDQIAEWLRLNDWKWRSRPPYVVLDDDDGDVVAFCQGRHNHPFVKTDGTRGLTAEDADRAIAILNGDTS